MLLVNVIKKEEIDGILKQNSINIRKDIAWDFCFILITIMA